MVKKPVFLIVVALEPFSSDTKGTKLTSKDVRSTLRFGYTYPETSGNASVSAVRTAINRLYGSNASTGGPVKRTVQAASEEDVDTAPGMLVNGCLRHYAANVVSQKFTMNGCKSPYLMPNIVDPLVFDLAYAIYVFIGDFEDDPATWPLSHNLAGTHAVAASMATGDVVEARLAALSNVKVTGVVPLTDSLLKKVESGELASMEISAVEAYLSENLKWRAATVSNARP